MIYVHGKDLEPYLNDVIRLRLEVFREYPYLYEGTEEEEYEYISDSYMQFPESLVVLLYEDHRIVGIATGKPLKKVKANIQSPLSQASYPIDDTFYLGELVLEKAYRGKMLGQQLYQSFENYVKKHTNYRLITFSEVERPPSDPLRPAGYISNENFWKAQEFVKHPEIRTLFRGKSSGMCTKHNIQWFTG
jgi:GNAT superfamily N-acetyltransferase